VAGPSERLYAALPIALQNAACSWAGWRRSRLRFGPGFHATLAERERSVDGPREALVSLQRRRLDGLVERARTTTDHYRSLPPPSDHSDSERALEDTLARIPVLEKRAYRERPEAFLSRDVPPGERIRGKTSGTTGTALPLWFTRQSVAEEFAIIWRQRRHFGVGLDDPNLTFNGQIIVPFARRRPPFWRVNHFGAQTLFSLYHMSPANLESYVDAVHSRPATWVQGYPSSLFLVAEALLQAERPLPPGHLRAVFTSSESLLAFQRSTIERAFGAPVRDRYGVSELAVSMTECSEGLLHVDMEFGIVEVDVREETPDYERGDLIVTGFANDATPWIRYRVGDVGTRSKRPCSCGRPGDVFLEIDGRIEDYVVTPDGRRVGRLDHIFKEQLDVFEAQILQETRQAVEILVVPGRSYDAASERKLLREVRSRLGEEIDVKLRLVDAIPRESNGKFRAVKSSVGART
jgi:phenylacetate-CoA ligase